MDVIGGGLLVAVAALLWIAYLLPSWLRRRQYLATERNAVRLQQTLRILAETAETPEPVRVEATAREVATQQRILHEHETATRLEAEAAENLAIAERRAAEGRADAARTAAAEAIAATARFTPPTVTGSDPATAAAATPASAPVSAPAPSATATSASAPRSPHRALRRKRALCSLVLLASLVTVVVGFVAAPFGVSLLVPAAGGLGVMLALGGILRLAKARVPDAVVQAATAREATPFEPIELAEAPRDEPGWTPQPLPRPLHLSRGTIAAMAMASIEAAAELKRAETGAEVARRAAELEPEVPSIRPPAPAAAPSRRPVEEPPTRPVAEPASPYSRMGIVDDARPGIDDLDAVLRRRREAG